MTPDEILDAGADLILSRGLAKGTLQDENGCLCAIGSMRVAWGGSVTPPELARFDTAHVEGHRPVPPEVRPYADACHALRDEIRVYKQTGSGSIPAWNDTPIRKKEEVVRTMKDAAARYRREHA